MKHPSQQPRLAIQGEAILCPTCQGHPTFDESGTCFLCTGRGYTIKIEPASGDVDILDRLLELKKEQSHG